MANEEHLAILKKGVEVWNKWRKQNPRVIPNLQRADLNSMILKHIIFDEVNVYRADLSNADMSHATLRGAVLGGANLTNTQLEHADLRGSHLGRTNLTNTMLIYTKLHGVDFYGANFKNTDLSNAEVSWSVFGNVDLRRIKGLESIHHIGPSTVGLDTIIRSKGSIPEVFLRGAGVPDNLIEYMHSLTGDAIQFFSCFISYSSKDLEFAKRLYEGLQSNGVRCWFAPEELKIGDEFRERIDESIRIYDKLLVILSGNSIESNWVMDEVEAAYEKEDKQKKQVLFPIRLDESIINTHKSWVATIRRRKHIGDFTKWKDHDSYQKAFERLLRDLKAEGKSND